MNDFETMRTMLKNAAIPYEFLMRSKIINGKEHTSLEIEIKKSMFDMTTMFFSKDGQLLSIEGNSA